MAPEYKRRPKRNYNFLIFLVFVVVIIVSIISYLYYSKNSNNYEYFDREYIYNESIKFRYNDSWNISSDPTLGLTLSKNKIDVNIQASTAPKGTDINQLVETYKEKLKSKDSLVFEESIVRINNKEFKKLVINTNQQFSDTVISSKEITSFIALIDNKYIAINIIYPSGLNISEAEDLINTLEMN